MRTRKTVYEWPGFNLIGDFVVWGDQDTLFGEMDMETDNVEGKVRSHGSLHEIEMPIFLYNAKGAPPADYFKHNLDLTGCLS